LTPAQGSLRADELRGDPPGAGATTPRRRVRGRLRSDDRSPADGL